MYWTNSGTPSNRKQESTLLCFCVSPVVGPAETARETSPSTKINRQRLVQVKVISNLFVIDLCSASPNPCGRFLKYPPRLQSPSGMLGSSTRKKPLDAAFLHKLRRQRVQVSCKRQPTFIWSGVMLGSYGRGHRATQRTADHWGACKKQSHAPDEHVRLLTAIIFAARRPARSFRRASKHSRSRSTAACGMHTERMSGGGVCNGMSGRRASCHRDGMYRLRERSPALYSGAARHRSCRYAAQAK